MSAPAAEPLTASRSTITRATCSSTVSSAKAIRHGDVFPSRWVRPVTWRAWMPENRGWWNSPTRGVSEACDPSGSSSPACRLMDAVTVRTQTGASPRWNRSRSASTSNRSRP